MSPRHFFLQWICSILFLLPLKAEHRFSDSTYEKANSSHVLVAISAYYNADRLKYLEKVLSALSRFPRIDVIVLTNTFDEEKLQTLEKSCQNALSEPDAEISYSIRSYDVDNGRGGFYLTWCHKDIIKFEFLENEKYSHFIYLEDDIEMKFDNFLYFLEYRELLRDQNLIPSFLRVEYSSLYKDFTNTDNKSRVRILTQPFLDLGDVVCVNLPNPYTACFILDKELAAEYIKTRSFDADASRAVVRWNIRERAAMGLCFEHVPPFFKSRYVVVVPKGQNESPKYTWVRHLPDNYAISNVGLGSIPMRELFVW